jgi:electron transport complex protein RnfB
MNPGISIAAIDALLPQTQCTKCGYPSCLDYAREIFEGTSDINRCPPGGAHSINALADLVGMPPKPLDPSCGQSDGWVYARINEVECIGCTLCIAACPVDAIVGSGKLMHTIIQDECTGCELCLPPCPVDCITLLPCAPFEGPTPWPDLAPEKADRARSRVARRKERLSTPATDAVSTGLASLEARRAEIEASVKRRRKQRQRADSSSSQ